MKPSVLVFITVLKMNKEKSTLKNHLRKLIRPIKIF